MRPSYVCPSCGGHSMSTFYEVRDVPVHSCLVMPTEEQGLNFPRGNILLAFCEECGFISNVTFDPSKLDYSSIYEDQQCYSSTFNAFAQDLAKRLIRKYGLHNKSILEIGCGKGDFLALLSELGHNYGVGIDPAYIEGRADSKVLERVRFIRDYYSDRYLNYHGDLLCCRHTLEHIHNTKAFVDTVRRSIGDISDTIVFFEVPDTIRILVELAFWDIYYEHCSYFSLGSLAQLFRSCRFETIDLCKDFGDQYLLIEAKPVRQASAKVHKREESVEEIERHVRYFAAHCHEKLAHWRSRLQKIYAEGRRAVIWGSGSKCVSFMTTLGVKEEIEYVVDINPHRHGKFIPGSGREIKSPEFLKKCRPDVIIVMNNIYCNEIKQILANMGISTEVIPV